VVARAPRYGPPHGYARSVRAELRGLYSPDVHGLDPARWQPKDASHFSIAVGAYIGPDAPPFGEELFTFTVCTASWLAAHPPPKGFQFVKGTLLVTRWDYGIVERAISDLCRHTTGDDWYDVATRLSRYGQWELET
jgi:hypothetical protein